MTGTSVRLGSAPSVLTLVGLALLLSCSEPSAPPVPEKLALITAPTSPAQNRIAFPTQPAVQVQDRNGNPMGAGIVVTAAISSGGGDLLGNTTATTGTNGIATFTDLSIGGVIGERVLTFSAPGISSVSTPVALIAGAPHQLTRLTPENQIIPLFSDPPILPSVRVVDIDGNPVPGVRVVFEILNGGSSIGGLDQLTNSDGVATLGRWTVQARAAGVTLLEVSSPGVFTVVHFRATIVAFNVIHIATGGGHACALTPDNDAYCWGRNDKGQLGDGTTTNRSIPTRVATSLKFGTIVPGPEHTCAVTAGNEGHAYCWGRNSERQTGAETDAAVVMTPVAVPFGIRFSNVTTSYYTSCGETFEESIYCWGGDPQLDPTPSPYPAEISGGLILGRLASGDYHSCAIQEFNSTTWCWGRNDTGQLGTTAVQSSLTPVRVEGSYVFHRLAAGRHTCGVLTNGVMVCWGKGQGAGFTDARVPTEVQGGVRFEPGGATGFSVGDWTCGLSTDGRKYCWGERVGRIVDGSENSYANPTVVSWPIQTGTVLQTSSDFVCGAARPGSVGGAYCWGGNQYGQLGTGNTTPSSQPRGVIPP